MEQVEMVCKVTENSEVAVLAIADAVPTRAATNDRERLGSA